jgi:hypothetical protein
MLANVQQTTIRPIIEGVVAPGSCIHTDEYSIYARLTAWGYEHKTVCHGRGEYARDEDGDGFCEVHVNTLEGFWSLLRSWLARTAAFPRRSCPSTWASFNSSTIPASAAKPCSAPSLPPWSHDQTATTPKSRKSHSVLLTGTICPPLSITAP